jgi:AcrR family transcriptional regulator
MGELSDTKELIFDVFVEMVSTIGYENVTTRDIAKRIGINAASIYYHFKSKENILEFAYDYYSLYQYDNRASVDVMKKLIETGNAEEIVFTFFYTFLTEDQKKYVRMILITKIIYMRLFQDPIANAIFTESHMDNSEYVISVLKHGVAVGRIDPGFDLETFADVLIGSMQIMGIKAFAGMAYTVGQLDQEKRILTLIARLLSTALK